MDLNISSNSINMKIDNYNDLKIKAIDKFQSIKLIFSMVNWTVLLGTSTCFTRVHR